MYLNATSFSSLGIMKTLIITTLCIGIVWSGSPIPQFFLDGLAGEGVSALTNEIQKVNKGLLDALEAFIPINNTCTTHLKSKIPPCRNCVQNRCEQRMKSECSPPEWQVILGRGIQFFSEGIPNFFTSKIPSVIVNDIGGNAIDITKGVGNLFSNSIPNTAVDIGKGVGKVAINLQAGAEDAAGKLVDIGKTFANTVVDVGSTVGKNVIDIGKKIIDPFKNIRFTRVLPRFRFRIGKRAMKREPSCNELENDASVACKVYADKSFCSPCSFNPDTDCAGYAAARARVISANAARSWMEKITDQEYIVHEVIIDQRKFKPNIGKYEDVKAKVSLFGKELSVTVSTPILPYNTPEAGPVIALASLAAFKSS